MYHIECRARKEVLGKGSEYGMLLINRSPRETLDGKVAVKVWIGNEVDYSRLRVSECLAYAHIARD